MTEHILNFAIGIEDDKIVEQVMKSAKDSIINDIKKDVINTLFEMNTWHYDKACEFDDRRNTYKVKNDAVLSSFSEDIIKQIFEENKEQIIDLAASKLAESYKRTKAWREKAEKTME